MSTNNVIDARLAFGREEMLHDLRVQMIRDELTEALQSKTPAEMRQRQQAIERHWPNHLHLVGRLAVQVADEAKAMLSVSRERPQ